MNPSVWDHTWGHKPVFWAWLLCIYLVPPAHCTSHSTAPDQLLTGSSTSSCHLVLFLSGSPSPLTAVRLGLLPWPLGLLSPQMASFGSVKQTGTFHCWAFHHCLYQQPFCSEPIFVQTHWCDPADTGCLGLSRLSIGFKHCGSFRKNKNLITIKKATFSKEILCQQYCKVEGYFKSSHLLICGSLYPFRKKIKANRKYSTNLNFQYTIVLSKMSA